MGKRNGIDLKKTPVKTKNGPLPRSNPKAVPIPPTVPPSPKKQAKSDLQTLLPGYIWVVPHFFTASECQEWAHYMDQSAPELLQQRGTRMMASRECYRHHLNDTQVAEQIWQRLQQVCPAATQLLLPEMCLGCNPNIRMYKYTKGMSFGKHIDESNRTSPRTETRMTVLIYLSACQGGATRFDTPDGSGHIAYEPVIGNMLIHLHGDDCLLHAGDPVSSGEKYILRTDLVYPIL
jgi:hypothetical protein